MTTIVFAGPSLSADDCRAVLPDAEIRPPVSQGDVTRAVLAGARTIGIIDGYFERVPAVWHKEILWAMGRGAHVFGAASMGALRAAELHVFGMIGVGAVFAAFRDGLLEDDDEVTVAHGPSEIGHLPTSVAMVDIRATLEAAQASGTISAAVHDALIALAKRTYYPERSYGALLAQAVVEGLPDDQVGALETWLPTGRVERKASDARAMLDAMAAHLRADPGPKRVDYRFQPTDAWEQVLRRDGHQVAAALPDALPMEGLLEELRLQGADYHRVLSVAFARALALREAERAQAPLDRAVFREVLHGFFLERGLRSPDAISAWLDAERLDADALTGLISRQAQIQRIETLFRDEILAQVPDALRAAGLYGRLASRAEEKRRWLAEADLLNPASSDWGQSETALLDRHFAVEQGGVVPDDLEAHARALGLANRHAFVQILVREHLFRQSRDVPPSQQD